MLEKAADETRANIRGEMPAFTGRALSTWGNARGLPVGTFYPGRSKLYPYDKVYAGGDSMLKGVWEFELDGLEHTQGGMPYVEMLNDGFVQAGARRGIRIGALEGKKLLRRHLGV